VTPSDLSPFLLSAFVLEITPGPNIGLLMIIAVNAGRKAGFATTAGIALGLLILGLAATSGMARVPQAFPALYDALRWVGAGYLLYLAYNMYRDTSLHFDAGGTTGSQSTVTPVRTYFVRGLVTNLLNPKAALFFSIGLPQFVPRNTIDIEDGLLSTPVLMVVFYAFIATFVHLSIVLFAATLQPILSQNRLRHRVQIAMAVSLVAVALWQFASTAR
jgi:threonine/homoserine/homoserine lactone efflux protein